MKLVKWLICCSFTSKLTIGSRNQLFQDFSQNSKIHRTQLQFVIFFFWTTFKFDISCVNALESDSPTNNPTSDGPGPVTTPQPNPGNSNFLDLSLVPSQTLDRQTPRLDKP